MCYKANKDKIYEELIVKIFNKNYQKYGVRRITDAINIELSMQESPNINHKRVERIMKKLGIHARPKQRKYISYKGDFGKRCKNLLLEKNLLEDKNLYVYKRDFETSGNLVTDYQSVIGTVAGVYTFNYKVSYKGTAVDTLVKTVTVK